ncbi:response regulator [Myxococcus sp. MISCRS1]|jgi:DNA-binding response OmpR family regulator|uniref:response regulator n=2 Tax=Myxococcaceae TaxID=31 RepID=UPI001CBC3395|nr:MULTISPECIES: response regulator [unclassified Myxococcus]MBZ4399511.1 response regulator [Myxococcus sp. AS-1-15]MBZ4412208.1 response regulator [Myxococcus sp. XM-1-1-1]MCY0995713.1 response regulator [Myxococcus sp. MISCRS1]BDT34301.1 response regulator [Myxococcus sp. MH1]
MSRVLVIDDSPMLVELTVRALTAAGYQVSGAQDLTSLNQKLSEGPFALILMDVNMPEMFGDDVVEYLRSQKKVTSKLVLYSDISEAELAGKTKASGADGYILKSGGLEAVISGVMNLIGAPALGVPAAVPAPAAPAPTEAPQAAPAAPAPIASTGLKAAPSTGGRKPRILIVDDSEMTARIIEADLVAKGFEVHVADTADKATKIILKKQTRPDLVLLDVRMPNVNGEQFCRFIKSNSLFKGIKVLLCSGENVEELQRICREAGADGYIPKDAVMGNLVAKELMPPGGE